MRAIAALDVRRKFGEIVDQAAAGERIIIERAGQPVAALVPLSDLDFVDPERVKARRLAAVDEVRRLASRRPFELTADPAELVRRMRDKRTGQIARAISDKRT